MIGETAMPDMKTEPLSDKWAAGNHPLDEKGKGPFGLVDVPVGNYHQKVKGALTDIIMEVEGVSEKSFKAVDDVIATADSACRHPAVTNLVSSFEAGGLRPEFCAETVFSMMLPVKEGMPSPEMVTQASSAVSYTSKIMSDITPVVGERISSWFVSHGSVGWFRSKIDNEEYEICISPASVGPYKYLLERERGWKAEESAKAGGDLGKAWSAEEATPPAEETEG